MTPLHIPLLILISTASLISANNATNYRLPDTTKPIQYTITLTLNPDDQLEGFMADTNIKISAENATDKIVLHANGIQIGRISVISNAKDLFKSYTRVNNDTDFLMIYLNANLTQGTQYDVTISHWSKYGSLDGAYRSFYFDSTGLRYLISTQFAPVSARKVFPCYDEPGMKAKFSITILAPNEYSAMSNMNAESTTESQIGGYTKTVFEETPIMPTYLVGFVVSKFNKTSLGSFSVNARPEAIDDAKYALSVGNKSLTALENYLGVPYIMPKMDYVAVPDFLFNAMENWGLITYKEEVLLYNKDYTPSHLERKITTVISHENAHNWFGNEVTPAWWGYVWLKEGFATYFENFITDEIFDGEMRQMEQFVVHTLQDTMLFDSLRYTNPMTSTVATPSDFMANYNYVAYPKAGSVIRMIRNALGEEIFKKGLNDYLKTHLKGSATPQDLFDSLDKAILGSSVIPKNVTIATIFSSWSDQASYPLVSVKRNDSNKELTIVQERYYQNGSMESDEKWWIPCTVVSSDKKTHQPFWIEPQKPYNHPFDHSGWYLLNPDQTGYYRVAYEEENWIKLNATLHSDGFEVLSPLTRAQLLDDAFELAKTNRLPYSIPLDMAMYLEKETNYIPWVSAQRAINYIGQFSKMQESLLFQEFKATIVKKLFETVGFDYNSGDSLVKKLTGILAIDMACGAGISSCRIEIIDRSISFFANTTYKEHPDLRPQIYAYGYSNQFINYDDFWKMYVGATYQSERAIILDALSRRQDYMLQKKFIESSIMEGVTIRDHERANIVISVIKTGTPGVRVALEFLLGNYFKFQQMTRSPNALARVIDTLGSKIYDDKQIKDFVELESMTRSSLSTSETRAFERAFEVIALNQRWMKEEIPEIEDWLKLRFNSADIKEISIFLMIVCSIIVFFTS